MKSPAATNPQNPVFNFITTILSQNSLNMLPQNLLSKDKEVPLLHRCKEIIQNLHSEVLSLQLTTQLLQAQSNSLRGLIDQKNALIKELEQRIDKMHSTDPSPHDTKNHSFENKSELLGKYQELLRENLELKRQVVWLRECRKPEREELEGESAEVEEGLIRMIGEGEAAVESLTFNDILSTDKKVLAYLLRQKEKEVVYMGNENRRLKNENYQLNNGLEGNYFDSRCGQNTGSKPKSLRSKNKRHGATETARSPSRKSNTSSARLSNGSSKNKPVARLCQSPKQGPRPTTTTTTKDRKRIYSPTEEYYTYK